MHGWVPDGGGGLQGEPGAPAPAPPGVEPNTWEELQLVLRGMDMSQLLNIISPPAGGSAEAGAQPRVAEPGSQSSGGAHASADGQVYDPEAGEIGLLLHAVIDGQPSVGADKVQIDIDSSSGRISLISPHLEQFLR